MSELSKQLRAHNVPQTTTGTLAYQAAVEIERLEEELAALENHCDLYRDEFIRIKNTYGTSGEIRGLCERALSDIASRIPIIKQVDSLQKELAAVKGQLEAQSGHLSPEQNSVLRGFIDGAVSTGKLCEVLGYSRCKFDDVCGAFMQEIDHMRRVLTECAKHDGVIVPTGLLSELMIAENKACGNFICTPDGLGFVPLKREWVLQNLGLPKSTPPPRTYTAEEVGPLVETLKCIAALRNGKARLLEGGCSFLAQEALTHAARLGLVKEGS